MTEARRRAASCLLVPTTGHLWSYPEYAPSSYTNPTFPQWSPLGSPWHRGPHTTSRPTGHRCIGCTRHSPRPLRAAWRSHPDCIPPGPGERAVRLAVTLGQTGAFNLTSEERGRRSLAVSRSGDAYSQISSFKQSPSPNARQGLKLAEGATCVWTAAVGTWMRPTA